MWSQAELPFGEEQKPTPEQRQAQQLVEIRDYLHEWNEVERVRRLAQAARPPHSQVPVQKYLAASHGG